jgi:hypothetical protein
MRTTHRYSFAVTLAASLVHMAAQQPSRQELMKQTTAPAPVDSTATAGIYTHPVGSRTGAVFRRSSLACYSPFPLGVPQ